MAQEEADNDSAEEMVDNDQDMVVNRHQWGPGFMIGNRLEDGREEPMDDVAGTTN